MKNRILGGIALGVLALAAGSANATVRVYNLNVADPGALLGGGPFGTVTVEDSVGSSNALITAANQLLISVDLNDPTYQFRTATGNGQFADSLAFNLAGVTGSTFESPAGGVAGGGNTLTFATGSFMESWAGSFGDAVRSHDGNPPPSTFAGPLQILLTDSGAVTVNSLTANHVSPSFGGTYDVFLTADLINTTTGKTGIVGATLAGGVPEPATWAMMLVGFGGMGALLRRRRSLGLVAAA
jgi:hypothetical protein